MITVPYPPNRLMLSLLTAVLLLPAPLVFGQDDHGHDDLHRQLDAHVHGGAQLLMALDQDHLTVVLESPSVNVVGFEHPAQNADDRRMLETAEALLADPDNVFALAAAAQCTLESAHIESAQLAKMRREHAEAGHGDHDHLDETAPAEHHEDHEHEDHSHEEHDHEEDGEGSPHSEFHVEYQFHCKAPARLNHLEVTAFSAFPGFEAVDVQWILDGQQGAFHSGASRTRVEF